MDLHSNYNHRWHGPKVKSYNSPIHGLGVVAVENIKEGELVFVYGGVVVPKQEIESYWKQIGHVGIQVEDDFWICPTSREELEQQGVINHSCYPNVGFISQLSLVVIRDIKSGEEITFDYAFTESFMEDFECKCNSDNCRHLITQNDWQKPDIRQKYGKFFSPYLKINISAF